MARLKVLLCGDSFAADWSVKNSNLHGWPNDLASSVDLTNLARAGCSEYRILKQIKSIDLAQFDRVIVSHTSPYRIYVRQHPVHQDDSLYKDCDLIYSDCVGHGLQTVKEWFENYFDLEYAIDIHHMIMREIATQHDKICHIGHMDISAPKGLDFVDFSDIWKQHPGKINHYNEVGNKKVYKRLLSYIT
jgi:hypothetical protein